MAGELDSTSSRPVYEDLELKRHIGTSDLSILDSHPVPAVATDNYEEITPLQTADSVPDEGHLTLPPNKATYQAINEALLDTNTKPTSIYSKAAVVCEEPDDSELASINKEASKSTKDSKDQSEEWKYKVMKRVVLATVIILVLLLVTVVCLSLSLVFIVSENDHLKSPAPLTCDSQLCELASLSQRFNTSLSAVLDEFNNLRSHLLETIDSLGQPSQPAASCAALLAFSPMTPSGYYWVRTSNSSAVRVYCDMTLSCGNITGGWTRVAELNMTNSTTQCPGNLRLRDDLLLCGIRIVDGIPTCSSVKFTVSMIRYSSVCGRIAAYQGGSPEAFHPERDINGIYVDGVSLTHGSPRQHIWTFAAADESVNSCPCSSITNTVLPFVGNDYFCDGLNAGTSFGFFEVGNSLWDGIDCDGSNACCIFNNPPWFYKQLPESTTNDIEMRVCCDQPRGDEDIGIGSFEIYIQ